VVVATAVALGGFAGGLAVGAASDTPGPSPSLDPSPGDEEPRSAASYLRYRPATRREPFNEFLEPYAFDPAPPLEATSIDGYYLRIVELDEVGGPRWGLPFHCRRCPAFRVDPGVETLLLYRGRFWLEHQMSGFRAFGHYEVRGDRITFFNDPNCSQVHGRYRWSMTGRSLSFQVLDDVCAFEGERPHDLMFSSWIAVRPCRSGIQYWWPALIGCRSGESGVQP
jgi:hypothetical protein